MRAGNATSLTGNTRHALSPIPAASHCTNIRKLHRFYSSAHPSRHSDRRNAIHDSCHGDVIDPQNEPAEPSTSYCATKLCNASIITITRRRTLVALASSSVILPSGIGTASASKVPFLDAGWEALGGGPSDLVFPEDFLGVWDVTSVLTRVEMPLGEDVVPNLAAVRRAQREDLDRRTSYQVAFVRNGAGKVVYDRRFNTASMLSMWVHMGVRQVAFPAESTSDKKEGG
ncbi:hypothetical protein Vretifemale_10780 [Volvox reticuliferus]|uniref:DUF6816 domain-containing protein n=1 Tax=Volvox reticuliferus TaxID=1737510 RepID=A0A8J4CKW9_9CHLO|nr:hypothetical protein Vretifemale_10780 [Volvox reticuliferus]